MSLSLGSMSRTTVLGVVAAGLVALLAVSKLISPASTTRRAQEGDAAPVGSALPPVPPGAPPGLDEKDLAKRYASIAASKPFEIRSFKPQPARPTPAPSPGPARLSTPVGPSEVELRYTAFLGQGDKRTAVLEDPTSGKGLLVGIGKALGPESVAAIDSVLVLAQGEAKREVALGDPVRLPIALAAQLDALKPPVPEGLVPVNTGSSSGSVGGATLTVEERTATLERMRMRRAALLRGDKPADPAAPGAATPGAPASGATPPAEGATPPASGATPPASGATPPAEGAAPPGSGPTTPGAPGDATPGSATPGGATPGAAQSEGAPASTPGAALPGVAPPGAAPATATPGAAAPVDGAPVAAATPAGDAPAPPVTAPPVTAPPPATPGAPTRPQRRGRRGRNNQTPTSPAPATPSAAPATTASATTTTTTAAPATPGAAPPTPGAAPATAGTPATPGAPAPGAAPATPAPDGPPPIIVVPMQNEDDGDDPNDEGGE